MAWTKDNRRTSLTRALRVTADKRQHELQIRAAKRLARGKGGAATLKRAGNASFDVSKHTGGVDLQELINRRKQAK